MSEESLLKNDIVFQELFGRQKNCEITKHLISLILGRKISNIELDVNKRMLGNRKDSKIGRLDIRAKFDSGEDCNIELQVSPYAHMEKRLLSYWSMMYNEKISKGDKYEELKPSICILIAMYKLENLKEISEYHTIWNLREQVHKNKILSQDVEIHILEVPKIKEILKDELALWLKFIQNYKSEEVKKAMCYWCENKYFKQAMEELEDLKGDPEFYHYVGERALFLMDQNSFREEAREKGLAEGKEEGRKEGRKEGLAEGKREGRKKEKVETAKKLLKIKMPIEQIIEITELTKEEIDEIAI